MTFRVGQKVVCIVDFAEKLGSFRPPGRKLDRKSVV